MQSCYQNICPRSGRYASAPHAKDGFQDPPQGFWRFHYNDLHSIASLSLQIRLSQSLPCSPTQAPAPNAASQTGWSSRVAPAAQAAAPYSRFLPCDVIKAAPLTGSDPVYAGGGFCVQCLFLLAADQQRPAAANGDFQYRVFGLVADGECISPAQLRPLQGILGAFQGDAGYFMVQRHQ